MDNTLCPMCQSPHKFDLNDPYLIAEFKRMFPELPLADMVVVCEDCIDRGRIEYAQTKIRNEIKSERVDFLSEIKFL